MEIVRRNQRIVFGEHIGDTWFPPYLSARTQTQRWCNPRLYQRTSNRPLTISRYQDCFLNALMDYTVEGGVKRKFRGTMDTRQKKGTKEIKRFLR